MAWTAMTQALTPQVVPSWRYVYPLVRFFQQPGKYPPVVAAPAVADQVVRTAEDLARHAPTADGRAELT
jgi:hypothetical protein